MPSATATKIVDAALSVLGTGGIHALSHARVDTTAQLPPGSTSNYFRTRAALMSATVARLHELDEMDWQAAVAAGPPTDLARLADALAAFVDAATGPQRTRTVARYVIFVQGVVEPALMDSLNGDRRRLVDLIAATLTDLGVDQPIDIATTLLAAVEGLILHRLTGFAAPTPVEPQVRNLINALCKPDRSRR
ncbi:MAG TPA: TetR family transcriptional regulator [Actinoplanes sp.]|nr:TetR family transcriptional regulator [Actinoplanes sp.]